VLLEGESYETFPYPDSKEVIKMVIIRKGQKNHLGGLFIKAYCLTLILVLLNTDSHSVEKKTLRSIYNSGKIRFIREIVISDKSLPDQFVFESLTSIVQHKYGNVFVCDYYSNNIKKFSPKGDFIQSIGKKGQGPGDFYGPSIIEVSDDRLIVWEYLNRRVSILNLNGEFITSRKFSHGLTGLPKQIRTIQGGKIIIETEKHDFSDANFPQECHIGLYSADLKYEKTIYSRKQYKSKHISKPVTADVKQPFNPIVHWDASHQGKIIIGYSKTYEIEAYDPLIGKLFSFSHKHNPIRIINEDKEKHFSKMKYLVIKKDGTREIIEGPPKYIEDNTIFPQIKPVFDKIIIDSEENIWIHPFLKERESEDRYFDAFSDKGEYLNRVEILGDTFYPFSRCSRIIERCIWRIEEDEEGYFKLVKYRILI